MGNLHTGKKNIWQFVAVAFTVCAVILIAILALRKKNESDAEAAYAALSETVNAVAEETVESTGEAGNSEDANGDGEETVQTGLSPEGLLAASMDGEEPEDLPEEEKEPVPEAPGKGLDWDELHKTNSDIYAWIYVPGTSVDYPILQHPSNNEYYLNHNLDKSSSFPGVIYTENYNSKDFTDPHTVIYGHNMDNTTMFSTLHKFADPKMFEDPHYFFIYTEDGRSLCYEVVAAYEYPSFHLMLTFDCSNQYIFEQYLSNIENIDVTGPYLGNVRHDVELDADDHIVTLSTCTTDHDAQKRFLVVGVLLNP